jgi:hypothetical protein
VSSFPSRREAPYELYRAEDENVPFLIYSQQKEILVEGNEVVAYGVMLHFA